MDRCSVVIVGGGPAGSTCARALGQGGLDVVILDKAAFPRPKLCAGWVTPAVFKSLRIDPLEYGGGRVLQGMSGFRVGRIGGPHEVIDYGRTVSFGICRSEFDDYLLRRSGARLCLGEPVRAIERSGQDWVLNGQYRTPLLVAAGGNFCPVARLLGMAGTDKGPIVAAEEFEIPLTPSQQATCAVDPQVPEIYFCHDLLGYGWCLRKGPLLNIGLGREDRRGLPAQVKGFYEFLARQGRITGDLPGRFRGHAYQLYDHSTRPLLADGVLWIGDAAGLAWTQSGEGIGPAVESALLAAGVVLAAGGDYRHGQLQPYLRLIEARFGRRRRAVGDVAPSALRQFLGRRLLANRWFIRRVVLDRWFLRQRGKAEGGRGKAEGEG
jgi:flavin-dependent dehydrogenase